jgi:hypothetical protein
MTDAQIEIAILRTTPSQNRRLESAIDAGAVRIEDRPLFEGMKCAICRQPERGGDLLAFSLREGQELLAGERCALYLGYLIAHPDRRNGLLGWSGMYD